MTGQWYFTNNQSTPIIEYLSEYTTELNNKNSYE